MIDTQSKKVFIQSKEVKELESILHLLQLKICTGWPKPKFEICFGYNSENMRFWPYVGKAKMCLGGESLFWKIVNK